MSGANALILGALAVIAVFLISAIIMAIAPYLAIIIVVAGVCWFFSTQLPKEEKPPDKTSVPIRKVE